MMKFDYYFLLMIVRDCVVVFQIERAQVLVDDRGNSLKEGIVEFARKPTALLALRRCAEGCFFLTRWVMFPQEKGKSEVVVLMMDR